MSNAFDLDHRFVVFSRLMAENWNVREDLSQTYAVISITSNDGDENGACVRSGYADILRLRFDDISSEHIHNDEDRWEGFTLFDEAHAHAILDFHATWRNSVDKFMIHCEAGVSRSAGVAVALARIERVEDAYIYKSTHPNAHVIRTILSVARQRN